MQKVYIEWYDAYTRDSWESKESVKEICSPMMKCKTIGFLLDESKEHVTICHTINPAMVMGLLHILVKCINKIKKLK